MDPQPLSILGIAGSLRAGSFNRALLVAAQQLAPPTMTIDVFELASIPFFSQDLEEQGDPHAVRALKAAIARSDGLLIATPEYQEGIPGVLKNALDWASRPADGSVMADKVAAIMGATPGAGGTARAQTQLRQTLGFTATFVVPKPEVLVADADHAFDAGMLVDADARKLMGELLENLARLIHRLRAEAG